MAVCAYTHNLDILDGYVNRRTCIYSHLSLLLSRQGQKARIAALYFPLVPLVLNHVPRLDTGGGTVISPMLNAASMATYKADSSDGDTPLSMSGSVPGSAAGSECCIKLSEEFFL